MELTEKQKRHLRALGHAKKPVVFVGGASLTSNVVHELDEALKAHELLKVRVGAGDREERDSIIERMCREAGATLVQRIGHVALLYRPAETPRIQLPT